MKARDADIIIVPGYEGSGPDHWQTRWEGRLSTARRIDMQDWKNPVPDEWRHAVTSAVAAAERPVVLVGHSIGVAAIIRSTEELAGKVAGAFLVAPPDVLGSAKVPGALRAFGAYSRDPLPFPSVLVASRNDPYCAFEVAEDLGAAWGSLFIDARESGHINADAGFGPWPEGTMVFANFLGGLKA